MQCLSKFLEQNRRNKLFLFVLAREKPTSPAPEKAAEVETWEVQVDSLWTVPRIDEFLDQLTTNMPSNVI